MQLQIKDKALNFDTLDHILNNMQIQTPENILKQFTFNNEKIAITQVNSDINNKIDITYSELANTIIAGANYLHHKLNLKKGDTVSYLFDNCPEILTINLICFFAGLRVCPLDSKRDTQDVILRKVKETKTKVLFYRNEDVVKDIACELEDQNMKLFPVSNFHNLKSIFGNNNDRGIFSNFDAKSTCLILYTSGTTAFPKGAMLSFDNLFHGAMQVSDWFKIEKSDKFYVVLPLHHINSTIFSLATILKNGSLVITPKYSKSNFFKHVAETGATMSSIVPTINLDLLEEEDSFKKYSSKIRLKRIQIGSAPVSAKNASEFVEKYKIPLIQGYGSTETSLRVSGIPVDLPTKEYLNLLQQNSIGEELSQNNMALLNKTGEIIDNENTDGEIGVKGPNIMAGYLNREDETKKAFKNGYFIMGDIGFYKKMNGKKFFFLKGRSKEIIIKGGVNISPLYVEEKLREEVPWARDIVVLGFPHYRFGEEIGVIIIPKNNQNEIKELNKILKEGKIKNLSEYETPKIAILADDKEIPRTSTGKIQGAKAKKIFEDRLIEAYKIIGENNKYKFRIITPDENKTLKKALKIHNTVFPNSLKLDFEKIKRRSVNGFVIGAFDGSNKVIGVLTGFFTSEEKLKKESKWAAITNNGAFPPFNPKGNVALLTSAASTSSEGKTDSNPLIEKVSSISEDKIKDYISTKKDYVVRFHFLPKAGFEKGANVYRIILNGNTQDKESLGVVVLFDYPELKSLQTHKFTSDKIGTGLVEAAIKYAKEQGKEKVIALSRLGEAYKYFRKAHN